LKQILDPTIARKKFDRELEAIGRNPHPVPQNPKVSWRIKISIFPRLIASVSGLAEKTFEVSLDCTNYDYDPPDIYFRSNGKPILWKNLQAIARRYPQPKGLLHDIVLYRDGTGFICREGNMGYHIAHKERNWLDIRATEKGRLFAIIENSLDALDLQDSRILER
jgi:hypothetical protein